MEWRWTKTTAERAMRLYGVATPSILGPETAVYVARQPGWILVIYQGVMKDYFDDRNAFIWRAKRDAQTIAAGLAPRRVGRSLDSIGAADDLRSAKILAEGQAHRMAE